MRLPVQHLSVRRRSNGAVAIWAIAAWLLAESSARASAPLNYLTSFGTKADRTLPLTWGVIAISVIVIVIIALLVAAAIWRRPGIAPQPAGTRLDVSERTSGLSFIWVGVGITSVVLVGTVVWTVSVLAQVAPVPKKPALTVEVVGHQWWWEVHYLNADPSQVFTTANEIHIPAGQPVRVDLKSLDVIHSFWVPALTGKTDLIPGQTNVTWLEAGAPGIYRGQCTEYCGVQHAKMGLLVVAQTPSDFAAWRAHQLQSPAQPKTGQQWAGLDDFTMHCGSCHGIRGTDADGVLGPNLSHLMQRNTIAAGMLANTPQNLNQWISDPQGIKPGVLMQRPELSDNERADIISYLKTLN